MKRRDSVEVGSRFIFTPQSKPVEVLMFTQN
jgi:hypothetical protein